MCGGGVGESDGDPIFTELSIIFAVQLYNTIEFLYLQTQGYPVWLI